MAALLVGGQHPLPHPSPIKGEGRLDAPPLQAPSRRLDLSPLPAPSRSPDLSPLPLWERVRERGGFPIEHVATIDSTNSELMRRAAAGDFSSVCLVAKAQTAGRGRLGRAWLSDEHALTFSVGLPLTPLDWSGLSLAVGVSLAESLHERIRIKWPNDLWVDGKKLAGILIETCTMKTSFDAMNRPFPHIPCASSRDMPQEARYTVIGVGINLKEPENKDFQAMNTPPAGLNDLLGDITAAQALERILQPLLQCIARFSQIGFAPFQSSFAARDALLGQSLHLSNGVVGLAAGVNAQGELCVQTPSSLQTVCSGEISTRA